MDGHGDAPAASASAVAELSGEAVSGGAVDRLSNLPKHLLLDILVRVDRADSGQAACTSVLSRRWRDLWVQLPSLSFLCFDTNSCARVDAALAARAARANGAPDISSLVVSYFGHGRLPCTASWLRLAPPILSGEFRFKDWHMLDANADQLPAGIAARGAFELLCFKKATKICLCLEFLTLALPSSGVFDALRDLRLQRLRFDGQLVIGDTMFPSLERLLIDNAGGLVELVLSSRSLVWLNLTELRGLQRLNVEARSLEVLCVVHSLRRNLQAANFSVERLKELRWSDPYDPALVKFGDMPPPQQLSVFYFFPYGWPGVNPNQGRMRILNHFSRIRHLQLMVMIESDLSDTESKMDCITSLPNIEILSLVLSPNGHVIGASVLYLLTKCTGIRELSLTLTTDSEIHGDFGIRVIFIVLKIMLDCLKIFHLAYKHLPVTMVQNACPMNCICDRAPNWRARRISMRFLREVEILNLRGEEHELDLLKLLLRAAPGLRRMRITCHRSFAAWERLSEDLQNSASQDTSLEVSQVTLLPE